MLSSLGPKSAKQDFYRFQLYLRHQAAATGIITVGWSHLESDAASDSLSYHLVVSLEGLMRLAP